MFHRRHFAFVALLILFGASTATAQSLTVETDAGTYTLGQTVLITIHNPTPNTVDCSSYPIFSIFHEDTATCTYGCIGLPVMESVAAGEMRVYDYDTSLNSDPAGIYKVVVYESRASFPPFTTLPTTYYTLIAPTPNVEKAWGGVKVLYR